MIDEARFDIHPGTIGEDLIGPGETETMTMTVAARAEPYAVGEFLMKGLDGALTAWDGVAAPVAVVAFELDAAAGPVAAGVLTKATLHAAAIVRPAALADDQAVRDALAGSRFTLVSRS